MNHSSKTEWEIVNELGTEKGNVKLHQWLLKEKQIFKKKEALKNGRFKVSAS